MLPYGQRAEADLFSGVWFAKMATIVPQEIPARRLGWVRRDIVGQQHLREVGTRKSFLVVEFSENERAGRVEDLSGSRHSRLTGLFQNLDRSRSNPNVPQLLHYSVPATIDALHGRSACPTQRGTRGPSLRVAVGKIAWYEPNDEG